MSLEASIRPEHPVTLAASVAARVFLVGHFGRVPLPISSLQICLTAGDDEANTGFVKLATASHRVSKAQRLEKITLTASL